MAGYKGVPTVRKRLLGGQLKRLREVVGISVEEAAAALGVGHSTIRRQESGHTAVSVADAKAYADMYRVDDQAVRERLVELAKHGRARGWWSAYGSKVGPTAVDVADAEDLVSKISTFQPLVIPGIFQTREYSEAVIGVGRVLRDEDSMSIADLVALRERRKQILDRENAPRIWAVVGEAAIRTLVGGPAVMREQVQHLLNLGERPLITIQVLPFSAGAHLGMSGAFVVLRYGEGPETGITYVENSGSSAFNDDPDEVRSRSTRFTHLQAQSLSIGDTRTYLLEAIRGL